MKVKLTEDMQMLLGLVITLVHVLRILASLSVLSGSAAAAAAAAAEEGSAVLVSVNRSPYGDSVSVCGEVLLQCGAGASAFVRTDYITCLNDSNLREWRVRHVDIGKLGR